MGQKGTKKIKFFSTTQRDNNLKKVNNVIYYRSTITIRSTADRLVCGTLCRVTTP